MLGAWVLRCLVPRQTGKVIMIHRDVDCLPSDQNPRGIVLPLPPGPGRFLPSEMEIYARFMRHIRQVPNSRLEIKIFSAIQFTADMLDYSDAHVAKTLVDLGLRAPRLAFPAEFLRFADMALLRAIWDAGAPQPPLKELKAYWDCIGEDGFASLKQPYQYSLTALSTV